ncbi:DUF5681 domain-containing protein [Sulfitobacter sp. MF3-043]|uniref:DUF5681 domain-containing protein n=1 Tax=Sulfitobacter sediminivivens TaxID=3252902 RepID=UPI0036D8003B
MSRSKADNPALTLPSEYEVGFGKPPSKTRFKPGQSGNPKGRPRGSKNKRRGLAEERMKDIILDEAYRGITVRDGHRNVTLPIAQAVMRSISVNAARGQHRAQRLFAELLASVETANRALHNKLLDGAIDYKVQWERELERRVKFGITDLPDPLPHPDHVKVDFRTGSVHFAGPMTKEEKVEYDDLIRTKEVLRDGIRDLTTLLETEDDPQECEDIECHIRLGQESLEYILRAIPD